MYPSNLPHLQGQMQPNVNQHVPVYLIPQRNLLGVYRLTYTDPQLRYDNLTQTQPCLNVSSVPNAFQGQGSVASNLVTTKSIDIPHVQSKCAVQNISVPNIPSQPIRFSYIQMKDVLDKATMSNFSSPMTTTITQSKSNFKNISSAHILPQPLTEPTLNKPAFKIVGKNVEILDLQSRDASKLSTAGRESNCSSGSDRSQNLQQHNINVSSSTSYLSQSLDDPQICVESVVSLAKCHASGTSVETYKQVHLNPSLINEKNCNTQNIQGFSISKKPHVAVSSTSDYPSTAVTKLSTVDNFIPTRPSFSSIYANLTDILYAGNFAVNGNHAPIYQKPANLNAVTTTTSCESIMPVVPVHVDSGPMKGVVDKINNMGKVMSEHDYALNKQINSDKSLSQQSLPQGKPPVLELVDLDKEDIDDCMLVKIDLSKQIIPYGLPIHNTQVIVHDSDTDDDNKDVKQSTLEAKIPFKSALTSDITAANKSDVSSNIPLQSIASSSKPGNVMDSQDQIESLSIKVENSEHEMDDTSEQLDQPLISDVCSKKKINVSIEAHQTDKMLPTACVNNKNQLLSEAVLLKGHEILNAVTASSINKDLNMPLSTSMEIHADASKSPRCKKSKLTHIPSILSRKKNNGNYMQFVQSNHNNKSVTSVVQSNNQSCQDDSDVANSIQTNLSDVKEQGNTVQSIQNILKENISIGYAGRQGTKTDAEKSIEKHQVISISQMPKAVECSANAICKICQIYFPTRFDLVNHTIKCHVINANYKCSFCKLTFLNESLFIEHRNFNCSAQNKSCTRENAVPDKADTVKLIKSSNSGISSTSKSTFKSILNKDFKQATNISTLPNNIKDRSHESNGPLKNKSNKQIEHSVDKNNLGSVESDKTSVGLASCNEEAQEQQTLRSNTSFTTDNTHSVQSLMNKSNPKKSTVFQNSDCQNTVSNQVLKCCVCGMTFSDSILRYFHMWHTSGCKKAIDLYCSLCSTMFNKPSDKHAHLILNKTCFIEEMQLMAHVVRTKDFFRWTTSQKNTVSNDAQIADKHLKFQKSSPQNEIAGQTFQQENQASTSLGFNTPASNIQKMIVETLASPQQDNDTSQSLNNTAQNNNFFVESCVVAHNLSGPKQNNSIKECHSSAQTDIVHKEQVAMQKQHATVTKLSDSTYVEKTASQSSHTVSNNTGKSTNICHICNKSFKNKSQYMLHKKYNLDCKHLGNLNISSEMKRNIASKLGEIRQAKLLSEFLPNKELSTCPIDHTKVSGNKDIQIGIKNSTVSNNERDSIMSSSVFCKFCNISFEDDSRFSEHLQSNPTCSHSEITARINTLPTENKIVKGNKKQLRMVRIASGISSSTVTVTLNSTNSYIIDQAAILGFERKRKLDVTLNATNLPISKTDVFKCNNNSELHLTEPKVESIVEIDVTKRNKDPDMVESNAKQIVEYNNSDNEDFSDLSDSGGGSDTEDNASSNEESEAEYNCTLCSKTFTDHSQFVKHSKLHSSSQGKKIDCKVCTRKFRHITDLQAHLLQFQYCFIPLTRKLCRKNQASPTCSMCNKPMPSSKELRKHCFKKMACRLRYVKAIIKNIKTKDGNKDSVLPSSAPEPIYKKQNKSLALSNEDSSAQNCGNLHVSKLQSTQAINKVETFLPASNQMLAHLPCLNCRDTFSDFVGHLLTHQACLDFYGIYQDKCPVSLPFCFKCKQYFDNKGMLDKHTCKGFVPYTHSCTACGLKFTSESDFSSHIKACPNKLAEITQTQNFLAQNKSVSVNSFDTKSTALTLPSSTEIIDSTEQSFPCLICNTRFPLLRLLLQHSYEHTEDTPRKCDRCGTTFVRYNQFVSHQAFHIRMDKESRMLQEQNQSEDSSPMLIPSHSSSSEICQQSCQVSENSSSCLFCHQEFTNKTAKTDHISNTPSCLGIMRYIIENKFFIENQETNKTNPGTIAPNSCEFCEQIVSDKVYHYLHSPCIVNFERAILRFRMISHQKESMSNQTVNENAITSNNLYHNEKHELINKLMPTKDELDDSFTLYCSICNQYLKSVSDAVHHKVSCKINTVLPIRVANEADWKKLRCTICDIKFRALKLHQNHMFNKHCEGANALMMAAGVQASTCTVCRKHIISPQLQSHFQNHKKKFFEKIKTIPKRLKVKCIFCDIHVIKAFMYQHIRNHSLSSIFEPRIQNEASVLENKPLKCSSPEIKTKKQKLDINLENSQEIFSIVCCKICQQVLHSDKQFQLHFQTCHSEYDQGKWDLWFSFLDPSNDNSNVADENSSNVVNFNDVTPNKITDHYNVASIGKKLCLENNYKLSPVSKIARPIGSCKICNRKFMSTSMFKFHLKVAHNRLSIRDVKKFFCLEVLSNKKHSETVSSDEKRLEASCSNYVIFEPMHENCVDSTVCPICQSTFTDPNLYQIHLKTHISQCQVTLNDCFRTGLLDVVNNESENEVSIDDFSKDSDIDVENN